ncbi:MAG TPA: hypothetical protein VH796_03015 [Nitrososphaeraceae archaeon]|jgi:hypothetical protein
MGFRLSFFILFFQVNPIFSDLTRGFIYCILFPRLPYYIANIDRSKNKRSANERYELRYIPSCCDLRAKFLIIDMTPAAYGVDIGRHIFIGGGSVSQ